MSINILFWMKKIDYKNNLSLTKDGRNLRSVKTQASIVNSATDLFLQSKSLEWPTAEQIAKHSGVGLRTVYRQFDDMDGLVQACHKKFMIELKSKFIIEVPILNKIQDRINFLIKERIKIYDKYKYVFSYTISKFQKSSILMNGLIEANIKLRERFENIVPEIKNMSLIDQAFLDAMIAFPSWYRLSSHYKFSNDKIINKFTLQTIKLINQKD
jgi:AcrR family transcriptional regulator